MCLVFEVWEWEWCVDYYFDDVVVVVFEGDVYGWVVVIVIGGEVLLFGVGYFVVVVECVYGDEGFCVVFFFCYFDDWFVVGCVDVEECVFEVGVDGFLFEVCG